MYTSTLGYYGKLPLSAEFIRCQASGQEIDELDQWLREGMYHAKSVLGMSWSTEFAQADIWSFLYLPPGRDRFLAGLFKASQDKAGREFPFLVYLLLNRHEFHGTPWRAPMQFKEFFVQGCRFLSQISAESDVNRLQFRLQALSPVEPQDIGSGEGEYHSLLLNRRTRDHWMDLFGVDHSQSIGRLLLGLVHEAESKAALLDKHCAAHFPLLPSNKEETYDLPFWIDVLAKASGRRLDGGILFWNRQPSRGKPLLIVCCEGPNPELMIDLIRPERSRETAGMGTVSLEDLTDAGRVLLDDSDVTLEALLHRLSA